MTELDESAAPGATTKPRQRTLAQSLTGLSVLCALGSVIVRDSTDSIALHRVAFGVTVVVSVVALYMFARTTRAD
jgi:hypothetical protein